MWRYQEPGKLLHINLSSNPLPSSSLAITIVGGSDTPLRCVVVQEVFPDGLVAGDGRLQPGDQIIEINGADMTCATHAQVIIIKKIIHLVQISNILHFDLCYKQGKCIGNKSLAVSE